MSIIKKFKEHFLALQPKHQKIIIVAVIGIVIIALLLLTTGEKKLSGSYNCWYRYDFTITKNGRGEYGGECKRYTGDNLSGTYSWYVEDNIVYINGEALLGYYPALDYIYELDSFLDITLHDDMTCTANEEIYCGEIVGTKKAGTNGNYQIVDNILAIVWDDSLIIREYGLVVNGKIYSMYGGPN